MSVLDNVIKIRALEQEQNNQMVDSLIKGLTLAQDYQKTNLLADIEKKKIQSELAKSGLQWNNAGTSVESLPPDVITGMGNMKDAMMSPTDRALKESLLASREEDVRVKQEKAQQEDMMKNLTPLQENATPEDKQSWLSQLDPKDASLVKSVTDYNYDIYRGLNFRDRERIGGLATMYDPTFSQAEFEVRKDYKKEFTKGKIGANIRSYNTVLGHLGSLYDTVENPNLPSHPVRVIEQAKRGATKQFFGDSPEAKAMANERNAVTAVSGELATVFKNSGGTDQEIQKWFDSYDKDATKTYKKQWIKQGVDLVNSRMGAISYDWERTMKKPVPSDQPIISPKAQQVIDKIGGGGASGSSVDAKLSQAGFSPDQIAQYKKAKGLK